MFDKNSLTTLKKIRRKGQILAYLKIVLHHPGSVKRLFSKCKCNLVPLLRPLYTTRVL